MMLSVLTSPQVHDMPSTASHLSQAGGVLLGALFMLVLLIALLSGSKVCFAVLMVSGLVLFLGSSGIKMVSTAYVSLLTGKPVVQEEKSLSFAQTIEKDYDVTVYDFSSNWIKDGWNFTALTEDKRYDCDVLPLENDTKYSVYCDQNGVTVALDTLVK